ncbi:hypothetical protein J3E69DRAFT_347254 [Trichoderma sp. SZMC 28015]
MTVLTAIAQILFIHWAGTITFPLCGSSPTINTLRVLHFELHQQPVRDAVLMHACFIHILHLCTTAIKVLPLQSSL